MAEPFSHALNRYAMEDPTHSDACLNVLLMVLEADRTFYAAIRGIDGRRRTDVVIAQMANSQAALGILRRLIDPPPPTRSVVITMDLSGTTLRGFMDPVAVTATPQQIASASELNVTVGDTCPICRDPVPVGTRLRGCGHCFHAGCISEWLGMNTRCPVCRHDIRDPPAYGAGTASTQ